MSSIIKNSIRNINSEFRNLEKYKESYDYLMGSPIVYDLISKNKQLSLQNELLLKIIQDIPDKSGEVLPIKKKNKLRKLRVKKLIIEPLINTTKTVFIKLEPPDLIVEQVIDTTKTVEPPDLIVEPVNNTTETVEPSDLIIEPLINTEIHQMLLFKL